MAPAHVLPYAAYLVLFVATALLCDVGATFVLARRIEMTVAWRWTVLVALLGLLAYVRFDLFASFALVLVLVEARRSPVRSGPSWPGPPSSCGPSRSASARSGRCNGAAGTFSRCWLVVSPGWR